MGHMRKQMLIQQKASFEQTLKERLAALAAKKDKAAKPEKDTIVRKLQAQVKAIGKRIAAIQANEKLTEDLARRKAEKAAAPKEEAPKAEKAKKGGEEGKAKKPKAEKPKTEKPAKPKAEGPKPEAAPKE